MTVDTTSRARIIYLLLGSRSFDFKSALHPHATRLDQGCPLLRRLGWVYPDKTGRTGVPAGLAGPVTGGQSPVSVRKVSSCFALLNVRFAPKATEFAASPRNNAMGHRLSRCSKRRLYSITSSAVASSGGGMVTPSALAVV